MTLLERYSRMTLLERYSRMTLLERYSRMTLLERYSRMTGQAMDKDEQEVHMISCGTSKHV